MQIYCRKKHGNDTNNDSIIYYLTKRAKINELLPNKSVNEQFLRVVRKINLIIGFENSRNCLYKLQKHDDYYC